MDKEVMMLYASVYSDLKKLAHEHEQSLAYLILGIMNTCAAEPDMINTISTFILGEIAAKTRVN